jgi:hypothetical protein
MVIFVILLKNRIEVPEVKSGFSVVEGWDKDTHSDLIINILIDLIL